jgi:hypothetical protein
MERKRTRLKEPEEITSPSNPKEAADQAADRAAKRNRRTSVLMTPQS